MKNGQNGETEDITKEDSEIIPMPAAPIIPHTTTVAKTMNDLAKKIDEETSRSFGQDLNKFIDADKIETINRFLEFSKMAILPFCEIYEEFYKTFNTGMQNLIYFKSCRTLTQLSRSFDLKYTHKVHL